MRLLRCHETLEGACRLPSPPCGARWQHQVAGATAPPTVGCHGSSWCRRYPTYVLPLSLYPTSSLHPPPSTSLQLDFRTQAPAWRPNLSHGHCRTRPFEETQGPNVKSSGALSSSRRGHNVGYAFINFTDVAGMITISDRFEAHRAPSLTDRT